MADGKFVAYYRVSTKQQGDSGLGLEAQQSSVARWLNGGNHALVAEFKEIESGARNDRPMLDQALRLCKREKATLVIAKLDRLSRNLNFIATLMESRIEFVAVDMPEASNLTIHIMAAMAEHEREMISERTSAALKAKMKQGWVPNAPSAAIRKKANQARTKKANDHALMVGKEIDQLKELGVTSFTALSAALNRLGIKTVKGGQFHPASVMRLIERYDSLQQPATG